MILYCPDPCNWERVPATVFQPKTLILSSVTRRPRPLAQVFPPRRRPSYDAYKAERPWPLNWGQSLGSLGWPLLPLVVLASSPGLGLGLGLPVATWPPWACLASLGSPGPGPPWACLRLGLPGPAWPPFQGIRSCAGELPELHGPTRPPIGLTPPCSQLAQAAPT